MPDVNLAPLDNVFARLTKCTRAYDDAYQNRAAADFKLAAARHQQLESLLRGLEPTLTDVRGLPGRPWFRHMIYAPGLYTGYGVKTLPGVREAIEQHRWADAEQYADIIAMHLGAYCDQVERATALLSQ